MKIKYSLYILIGFLTLLSCKEDIELVGEFKETAIIHGILDQADSVHFIKINRAFIGPGNALEFAQIPDSSYFESLFATITEKTGNQTLRTWELRDTIIDNKDENGIFYAPTQKLYYFSHGMLEDEVLNPEATYSIEIIANEGLANEFKINGETNLIDGLSSSQSNINSSFAFLDSQKELKAFSVGATSVGNAQLVNISLQVNFEEYKTNSDTNKVSIEWNAGESEVSGSYSVVIQGQRFYELISENVTDDELIIQRRLKSIDIIITGGSEDLNTYISSNQPSSSLTQTKPNFTNLTTDDGNKVIGVFTSRQTLKIEKLYNNANALSTSCLDTKSREYLCTGAITGNLLFCSDHNSDALKNYSCP